jgi:hypothetical protein
MSTDPYPPADLEALLDQMLALWRELLRDRPRLVLQLASMTTRLLFDGAGDPESAAVARFLEGYRAAFPRRRELACGDDYLETLAACRVVALAPSLLGSVVAQRWAAALPVFAARSERSFRREAVRFIGLALEKGEAGSSALQARGAALAVALTSDGPWGDAPLFVPGPHRDAHANAMWALIKRPEEGEDAEIS